MKSLVFILLLVVTCGLAEGLLREYIFISTPLGWREAQSYCRRYYKDLATITTMEENKRLVESGSGSYENWIGLRRTSGTWTWSDGEPLTFPNWFGDISVFPIYWDNCAVTSYDYSGFLVNYDCRTGRKFYCYRFLILVKENKTWQEAQKYCRTHYTGLASVISETSLRQLKLETVQTQTESVWTGLRFVNGIWFWVSGEQLGSLVSMPSCPALSYRCGALNTTTNTLKNRNCNDRLNFICYRK
ncbi:snaclec agglucetin subunit alpha-2-like [Pangasianodon hypophthalmus]|uniref:snaclec agglucetin subunit alpha-2-like n=1 Tax=Pangasianodon hypophthalmus TaxID=310915 RepID=UPI002306F965|nr:snaclec agglucetin subunit alpha-2-like [Pangasianodon hypophthalmus]